MIRLFVSESLFLQAHVSLSDKQSHYLLHVMRCKKDDSIVCFNGLDGEWLTTLTPYSSKKWGLVVQKHLRTQTSLDFCALCPALIKKDNFDLVLQKATELNVTDIYPLKLEHSVVTSLNKDRVQSILIEAAEQSERLSVPILHDVMDLKTLLSDLPKDIDVCYLSERGTGLSSFSVKKPAFIVGPEGGFTQKELSILSQHSHCYPVHFPNTILRAETASISALACWQLGAFSPCKK